MTEPLLREIDEAIAEGWYAWYSHQGARAAPPWYSRGFMDGATWSYEQQTKLAQKVGPDPQLVQELLDAADMMTWNAYGNAATSESVTRLDRAANRLRESLREGVTA